MNHIINKARKPKFELTIRILDLNNVPLVSGTSFVKWHLPSSTTAEHRGRTNKEPILDHKVTWNYEKTLHVRLAIDKTNMLNELLVQFEVVQDYSSGVRGAEKITLGNVSLNLAEYVEMSAMSPAPGAEDDGEGVVRRYLMQESKVNSTLKIGISMRQIDGDKNFVAPPLKTAPVFGGIAGIMGQEQGDQDELGHMPSINRSREAGELQDVYRKSLAASWAAQAGELPADQCIENIFEGGDGWKSKHQKDTVPQPRERETPGHHEDEGDDYERWHQRKHRRNQSSSSQNSRTTITARDQSSESGHRGGRNGSATDLRGHLHHEMSRGHGEHHHHHHRHHSGASSYESGEFRSVREVNELDIREDLMAWSLPGTKA